MDTAEHYRRLAVSEINRAAQEGGRREEYYAKAQVYATLALSAPSEADARRSDDR